MLAVANRMTSQIFADMRGESSIRSKVTIDKHGQDEQRDLNRCVCGFNDQHSVEDVRLLWSDQHEHDRAAQPMQREHGAEVNRDRVSSAAHKQEICGKHAERGSNDDHFRQDQMEQIRIADAIIASFLSASRRRAASSRLE